MRALGRATLLKCHLYEFEDRAREPARNCAGRSVNATLPVMVDGVIYVRARSVPVNISIRCPGPTADQAFNERIRKGFYRHEQDGEPTSRESTDSTKLNSKAVWEDRPSETRH